MEFPGLSNSVSPPVFQGMKVLRDDYYTCVCLPLFLKREENSITGIYSHGDSIKVSFRRRASEKELLS